MKPLPIRLKLTLLYFLVLAAALTLFGWVAYRAMQSSLEATVDEALQDEAVSVRAVIAQTFPQGRERLATALQANFQPEWGMGEIEVADERGAWIYQSPLLRQYPLAPRSRHDGTVRASYLGGVPWRLLDFDVRASGSLFHARVAVPVDDFAEALGAFRQFLWWSIPLLLAGASLGGYGLSRRALRPVEAISRAARAINPRHLGARLRVPPARDELRALTETLNGMLERIESAFQRITQFTADASHELRSPVALMRTTAEITLRQPRAESEYRAALNTILAEAEATSSLLEQLMLLARADSGFEAMRREPLDLARALQAAARRVEGAAASKRIAIEIRVPAGPVWVEGDAGALSRLFTILLDNAIKFSPPAAPVGIELWEDSGAAIAEIRDEGIGIAAEDLPMIFDRFFQADKARTRGARGAGLGLSIGRWIAEAHGGAITVESVPGRGSSFRVRIPLAAPNPV